MYCDILVADKEGLGMWVEVARQVGNETALRPDGNKMRQGRVLTLIRAKGLLARYLKDMFPYKKTSALLIFKILFFFSVYPPLLLGNCKQKPCSVVG